MSIPEEWGGAGMDTISYALMLEEVARVDASMAVAFSVTNSVAAMADFQAWHGRADGRNICRSWRAAKCWDRFA